MSASAPSISQLDDTILIQQMFILQHKLNERVSKNDDKPWYQMGRPYYRAAWVEAGEMMTHIESWKWWKAAKIDPEKLMQAKIEVVDIMHFILSDMLRHDIEIFGEQMVDPNSKHSIFNQRPPYALAISELIRENGRVSFTEDPVSSKLFDDTEGLIGNLILYKNAHGAIILQHFAAIMNDLGIDIPWMFKHYVAKNALNIFRQDNGYNAKGPSSYVKMWAGREDNEHLAEIIEATPVSAQFYEQVMDRLGARYRDVMSK
jgi:dimeric dUTPase (all-alpha-NTP-PPase superfamily)